MTVTRVVLAMAMWFAGAAAEHGAWRVVAAWVALAVAAFAAGVQSQREAVYIARADGHWDALRARWNELTQRGAP